MRNFLIDYLTCAIFVLMYANLIMLPPAGENLRRLCQMGWLGTIFVCLVEFFLWPLIPLMGLYYAIKKPSLWKWAHLVIVCLVVGMIFGTGTAKAKLPKEWVPICPTPCLFV